MQEFFTCKILKWTQELLIIDIDYEVKLGLKFVCFFKRRVLLVLDYNYITTSEKFKMELSPMKKYSKISPALKCYFLENLYYHCLNIRDAASKCRLNYSTAKIILQNLNAKEKKFVKRLLVKKEKDEKEGMNLVPECSYREIKQNSSLKAQIQVVSRMGFDFFELPLKKQ